MPYCNSSSMMNLNNSEQQLSCCKLQRRRRIIRRPVQCLFILSSFIIISIAIKYNLVFVTSFQFQRPSLSLLHTHTGYTTIIGGLHNNNHDRIRRRRPTTSSSFFILNELPSPSSKYLDHLCNVGVRYVPTFVLCFFCCI